MIQMDTAQQQRPAVWKSNCSLIDSLSTGKKQGYVAHESGPGKSWCMQREKGLKSFCCIGIWVVVCCEVRQNWKRCIAINTDGASDTYARRKGAIIITQRCFIWTPIHRLTCSKKAIVNEQYSPLILMKYWRKYWPLWIQLNHSYQVYFFFFQFAMLRNEKEI